MVFYWKMGFIWFSLQGNIALISICDPGPQTSHKGQFFEIEMYASSESWINALSIDVWFVMIGQYL